MKHHVAYIDFDDIQNPLLGAGQARATYEVGKRLVQRGHTVTVYCSKYPGYKDRVEEGIHYRHISPGTKHIRLNNFLYIFSVPFFVPSIKADIIIESFTAPISTLCSPLFTKIPVIGLPSMFNAEEFEKKYHVPLQWWEKLGAKTYKYFLPYSDVDSSKMRNLNPKIDYKIVPQGVDESFFDIPHKTPKHILFLSRLDIGQKGVDLLLQAYAKIKDTIPYALVIAGQGPDENTLKQMAKELSISDKVSFAGSAYGQKKNDLLSEAMYVAFPSRHEGLSLWSLEALAAGMPLICFDLPEYKWMGYDCNIRAKPFDIDDYARCLLAGTETNHNAQLRQKARELAKQYSWEHVVDMFEEYFEHVLANEKYKQMKV